MQKQTCLGRSCVRPDLLPAVRKWLHAYANYASGSETRENLYGFEPWRLQKLEYLKKKYDPDNIMGLAGGWKVTA